MGAGTGLDPVCLRAESDPSPGVLSSWPIHLYWVRFLNMSTIQEGIHCGRCK